MDKPICTVLCGMPGSGKSTWADNLGMPVVGSDRELERFAEAEGKSYDSIFIEHQKAATRLMNIAVEEHKVSKRDFVWDQTNLSVNKRAKVLRTLAPDYYVVCVYFNTPESVCEDRRLQRIGKTIPDEVVEFLHASLEKPTLDEGFDKLIEVRG